MKVSAAAVAHQSILAVCYCQTTRLTATTNATKRIKSTAGTTQKEEQELGVVKQQLRPWATQKKEGERTRGNSSYLKGNGDAPHRSRYVINEKAIKEKGLWATTIHQNDKAWITSRIKNLIKKRQKAFRNKHESLWRYLRNRIKREIKIAKVTQYTKKTQHLKSSNPGAWFKEILVMSGKSYSPGIRVPDIECSYHAAIAHAICGNFSSVVDDEDPCNSSELLAFLPSQPIRIVQPFEILKN